MKHKRFFKTYLAGFILVALPFLVGFTPPQNTGYVTDPAGILSTQEKQALSDLSQELQSKTKAQVATLIVPSIGDDTIENVANEVFNAWGIGDKKENRGLLFIVALQEKKVRIEVGYGLEPILTDGASGDILRSFVIPYFKKGDIKAGIVNGHLAIIQHLANAYQVEINGQKPVAADSSTSGIPDWVQVLMLIAFVMFLITGRGWLPLFIAGGMMGPRSGGGFSDFGGSGFGGFGGGSSGGGGASSSW